VILQRKGACLVVTAQAAQALVGEKIQVAMQQRNQSAIHEALGLLISEQLGALVGCIQVRQEMFPKFMSYV
jgi:hypothetical protein